MLCSSPQQKNYSVAKSLINYRSIFCCGRLWSHFFRSITPWWAVRWLTTVGPFIPHRLQCTCIQLPVHEWWTSFIFVISISLCFLAREPQSSTILRDCKQGAVQPEVSQTTRAAGAGRRGGGGVGDSFCAAFAIVILQETHPSCDLFTEHKPGWVRRCGSTQSEAIWAECGADSAECIIHYVYDLTLEFRCADLAAASQNAFACALLDSIC